MLSKILRKFLFNVVHLFINLLVAAQNVYHQFRLIKYDKFSEGITGSDVKMILELVPRMKKRLKHLVVMADTSNHSISDLAKVVIWSLVAGIPYVSFHDVTGDLINNEEKLFLEIEMNKKGIPGCIKWPNKPDLNGYTNGIQANTVNINIITNNAGRPNIAQCIRQIAQAKIPCKRNSEQFTAQELDEVLSVIYPSIPDPELVLYTGRMCCTHGLLPWHIRLTEFIQLSINHRIDVQSYLGALHKYSKCDQRFGK